jgi:hypothetical protein
MKTADFSVVPAAPRPDLHQHVATYQHPRGSTRRALAFGFSDPPLRPGRRRRSRPGWGCIEGEVHREREADDGLPHGFSRSRFCCRHSDAFGVQTHRLVVPDGLWCFSEVKRQGPCVDEHAKVSVSTLSANSQRSYYSAFNWGSLVRLKSFIQAMARSRIRSRWGLVSGGGHGQPNSTS